MALPRGGLKVFNPPKKLSIFFSEDFLFYHENNSKSFLTLKLAN